MISVSQLQSLLSKNSESVILGQLGVNSSLRFLGPTGGVVPIGPNGLQVLNTLQPSPLSDAHTNAAIHSYNYTLNHQGLASSVSCVYDPQSPIAFHGFPNQTFYMYANASCDGIGQANVLKDVVQYSMTNTNNTLAFWACQSIPTVEQDPAYYIYLRGWANYATEIGNISCTVSPIQPAIFPVTYRSITGLFSAQEQISASTPSSSFSVIIEAAIIGLGNSINVGQTIYNNLVAASVTNLGVQSLALPADEPNEQYLPLYEAMIQGVLVDQVCTANNSSLSILMVVPQVTYLRFLYSVMTNPPRPSSCTRTVNGVLSAEVTGWVAKPVHIVFLTPMTILNLASLIIVLISIARAKTGHYEFDPTDPRSLVLARPIFNESEPVGWADRVSYRSRGAQMVPVMIYKLKYSSRCSSG